MSDIERKARELLAAEYERYGDPIGAEMARKQFPATGVTLRAIIAALTPPEGFVLVPVEPTEKMVKAVYPLHYFTLLGEELREHWRALLAARPEVK